MMLAVGRPRKLCLDHRMPIRTLCASIYATLAVPAIAHRTPAVASAADHAS
jgi:hypothetical protein